MTFNGAFKFYSYLLLIVAFLTLLFSGGLSIPMASLYLIAVAVSWRYQLRFLAGRFQFLIVLALILWLLVDSALLTSFMDSLIHLLLLVSLVKLFSLNSGRDYLILYLISFVCVTRSSYTCSVLFVVGLVVYLFCANPDVHAPRDPEGVRREPKDCVFPPAPTCRWPASLPS